MYRVSLVYWRFTLNILYIYISKFIYSLLTIENNRHRFTRAIILAAIN